MRLRDHFKRNRRAVWIAAIASTVTEAVYIAYWLSQNG
jgi:hypothetical protein